MPPSGWSARSRAGAACFSLLSWVSEWGGFCCGRSGDTALGIPEPNRPGYQVSTRTLDGVAVMIFTAYLISLPLHLRCHWM